MQANRVESTDLLPGRHNAATRSPASYPANSLFNKTLTLPTEPGTTPAFFPGAIRKRFLNRNHSSRYLDIVQASRSGARRTQNVVLEKQPGNPGPLGRVHHAQRLPENLH